MAFLLAATMLPASAATSVYISVLTHSQFTRRLPGQIGPPQGNGTSGGQTVSNSGSNSVGPGQVENPSGPEVIYPPNPGGQATLQFDDLTLSWSLSGTYSGFSGSILGVELFGAARVGYDAPPATRYVFPLQNDGGSSGSFTGSGTFSPAQRDDLRNGLLAFNILSSLGASESIRGQVTAIPEAATATFLLLAGTLAAGRRRNRQ